MSKKLNAWLGRSVGLAALGAFSASAGAVTLLGLTSANEIARIDTDNVAAATRVAISGLDAGDRFVGIDLRPADNKVYGVTLSNRIYTVDGSGATSFVANLSSPIVDPTRGYGVDFNPSADIAGASSLRVTSSAGSNIAINPGTRVVGNAASNIGPGFSAVAYSNAVILPTMAPPSTQLYYIDTDSDGLYVATTGFNAPAISFVGALGVDALNANGFELLANGQAFAALNTDASTSLVSGIYGINLTTGQASLIGEYNGTLSGLTLAPIPEPTSLALLAGGLGAVGFIARRRRRRD
jgi:hypothetical protein